MSDISAVGYVLLLHTVFHLKLFVHLKAYNDQMAANFQLKILKLPATPPDEWLGLWEMGPHNRLKLGPSHDSYVEV